MQPRAYVYILASGRNGTLYVGSTTDLPRRIFEHKEKLTAGFTSRYGVVLLVWYESYDRVLDARHREYAIKRWKRSVEARPDRKREPDMAGSLLGSERVMHLEKG